MHLSTRFAAALLVASALSGPAFAQVSFGVASASTEIVRSAETGLVEWMTGISGQQPVALAGAAVRSLSYEAAARAFLQGQSAAFGIRNAATELQTTGTVADDIGHTFVRFQQTYNGVPIIAAELNVQLDSARNVHSVNGKTVGDLSISVRPAVTAANARRNAIRSTARHHGASQVAFKASAPSLSVYDARLLTGPARAPRLVWRVEVTSATRLDIREFVLVDAQNGRVLVQFNQNHTAAPPNATQQICDAGNTTSKVPCIDGQDIPNPAASPIQDVKNAFRFTENTFDFYARRFDRNSLNGGGLLLVSTTRYCDPSRPCPYENAFWNGQQMVYGARLAVDDVVGHELSHGLTEFTSHLLYWFQSGAINESLSDIFGEMVDQTNGAGTDTAAVKWKIGEDIPVSVFGGPLRNMQNPPQRNDPDRMQSSLYTADPGRGDNGGVHTNSGVGNKTAFLMTEPGAHAFNGQSVTGIGIDKSAAIWYRVDRLLLQSGSDYADLGIALRQACNALVGTRPKNSVGNPSASGVITTANCQQVAKAVLATELAKPAAQNPIPAEAPLCPAGQVVGTTQLFEDFEGAPFKFASVPSGAWDQIDYYATSNDFSFDEFSHVALDGRLQQTAAVTIPAATNVTPFLHFHHYFDMTSSDGGVVEYQIGAGPFVPFPQTAIVANTYNATVSSSSGTVLANKRAFSGFSGGWTSSRVSLVSHRGKSIKVRFRGVASNNIGFLEWIADDIRIYTCKAAPPVVAAVE
jgi:Zn-dependent metalloprotease